MALLAAALALAVVTACNGGDGDDTDPEDFAKFAGRIADAVQDGDVDFLAARVQGTPHTCTEEEVAASVGENAPDRPICTEVGFQFEQVYIGAYGAPGSVTDKDDLITDLGLFFGGALPDEEDEYGPGSVQLYATAQPETVDASLGELHTAIITVILEQNARPVRLVRGLDFELVDGRWVIRGQTAASFPTAVDLLESSSAALIYKDWTRYE